MIKVEHLSKKFGELAVLRDVNAEIARGEVVSIIGPSGCGKSTFLRCLNLLARPSGGAITIDGVDALAKGTDVPALRQKMNMVFQSFNLFSHLTVMENLTLAPIRLKGRSRQDAEREAMELLQQAHMIGGRLDHPLTPLALVELGRLAQNKNELELAQRYYFEASMSAAAYEQPDLVEEGAPLDHGLARLCNLFPFHLDP